MLCQSALLLLTCVVLDAERGPDVRMCADPDDAR